MTPRSLLRMELLSHEMEKAAGRGVDAGVG